jgi:hypothetical protein
MWNVLVKILETITKGGGKGQYPENLPCCWSGGDGVLREEWLAISL